MGATAVKKSKRKQTAEAARKNSIAAGSAIDAAPAYENPLVPHAILRQMFQKMAEARVLQGHLLGLNGKAKSRRIGEAVGQEACRVSLVQALGAEDVVLDSNQGGPVMSYLLGGSLADGVGTPAGKHVSGKTHKTSTATTGLSRLLPFIEEPEDRMFAGIGLAVMSNHLQKGSAVVVFLDHQSVSKGAWRRALTLAGRQALPIIFVVLPTTRAGKVKSEAVISGLAIKCGVPGIPVDASDAVALYRVVQESIGRIRAGGGAVLIEGVPFHVHRKKHVVLDPVEQMKGYMMPRRVCPPEWFSEVERSFQERLKVKSSA